MIYHPQYTLLLFYLSPLSYRQCLYSSFDNPISSHPLDYKRDEEELTDHLHYITSTLIELSRFFLIYELMYDNQTVILNKRVVPLTQMEISSALNFSKMKTNAIFVELQNTGLIIQETRGKYSLTDIANEIIEGVCKLDKRVKERKENV